MYSSAHNRRSECGCPGRGARQTQREDSITRSASRNWTRQVSLESLFFSSLFDQIRRNLDKAKMAEAAYNEYFVHYYRINSMLFEGLELNKLRKHYDSKVSKIATMIYRSWKSHFKQLKDKPKIEVRTDTDTKKYRSAGRRLVEDILKPHKVSTRKSRQYQPTPSTCYFLVLKHEQ